LVNPAERFASGKVGIGINRKGKPALTVENIMIANSKGRLVAIADRFDITMPPPTPTRPPEPTPIPMPEPTRTPMPTLTPTPHPTPAPVPTPSPSPTPAEKPKTYMKPGDKRIWVERIENRSYEPKKRSIDLKFQGGDEGNLKIEIRVPKTPEEIKSETEIARKKAIEEGKDPDKIVIETEKSISEGSVFIVPPRGVPARITAITLPGARPTCFDISYEVQSEEEGRGNEPLAKMLLDRNICIEETLLVFFSQHNYHEKEQLVISRLHFYNLADIEQKTRFWVDINKCSFPIAEREFISDSKKISPDEPVVIPANKIVTYLIYSTPPADKKPSSPYCLVRFERILEK